MQTTFQVTLRDVSEKSQDNGMTPSNKRVSFDLLHGASPNEAFTNLHKNRTHRFIACQTSHIPRTPNNQFFMVVSIG